MAFQVNGNAGRYDNKIQDESIKYGRNAVENHFDYMEAPIKNNKYNPAPILDYSPTETSTEDNIKALEEFADKNDSYLNSLPPLEYEYRYMPNCGVGNIDKKAVLAAAYEEMGRVKELPLKDFEERYLANEKMTAKPLDINNDNKIDIAEYASNIIATDLLSKNTTDLSKVDGVINNRGMNAILEYTKKSNAEAAAKLYGSIYNTFGLNTAINDI